MPTPQGGRESIEIAAPPEVVYDLLADITRMGEWSPECYRCVWLDGASAAEVGTRFRGYNRLGPYRWERTAVVTAADRGRKFSFTTLDDRTGREQTEWHYVFEPLSSGTRVTESFQFLWCPALDRVVEAFVPRGRQVNRGIKETLWRVKQTAESTRRTL
jgi:hypothetical protein